MKFFADELGLLYGFADHIDGDHRQNFSLCAMAMGMGACVIEKHVTVDRALPGPDHHFAMTFEEFGRMAARIRETSRALGDGVRLRLLDDEYMLRRKVVLKAFSEVAIPSGGRLADVPVSWSRYSGDAVEQKDLAMLRHCRARNDIAPGEPITWDLLELDHR